MTRTHFDRAATLLGAAALLGALFVFVAGAPAPVDLAHVPGPAAAVMAVLGALGVLGGLVHRVALVIVAGAGLVAAALLQLAQLGRQSNWLGGDGSTVSLMGGLGLGVLVIGLAARFSPPHVRTSAHGPSRTP